MESISPVRAFCGLAFYGPDGVTPLAEQERGCNRMYGRL